MPYEDSYQEFWRGYGDENPPSNKELYEMIQNIKITEGMLGPDSVDEIHIKDASINSAMIQNLAVNEGHIDNLAVTTGKIDNLAVTTIKIANGAVDNLKIDRASANKLTIVEADIQDLAVGSAKIQDAAIQNAHLDRATANKIQIINADIVDVNAVKVNTGVLNTSLVSIQGNGANLKITGNRLQVFDTQSPAIERVSLGDVDNNGTRFGLRVRGADGVTVLYDENGVYNEGITDGAVTNPKIGDDAVDGRTIVANSVNTVHLVAESVTADKMFVNNLAAISANLGTVTAGTLRTVTLDGVDGTFTGEVNVGGDDTETVLNNLGIVVSGPGTGLSTRLQEGYIHVDGSSFYYSEINDRELRLNVTDSGSASTDTVGLLEWVRTGANGAGYVQLVSGNTTTTAGPQPLSISASNVILDTNGYLTINGIESAGVNIMQRNSTNPALHVYQQGSGDIANFHAPEGSVKTRITNTGLILSEDGLYTMGSNGVRIYQSGDDEYMRIAWTTNESGENRFFMSPVINNTPFWGDEFGYSYEGRKWYFDTNIVDFGLNQCKIDVTGNAMRLQRDINNYIYQDANQVRFYMGGNVAHAFNSDGTKSGGSIQVEGETLGMSPIDGPQYLLAYVIRNISLVPEGTKVQVDPTFLKTIAWFDVWLSQGKGEVTEIGGDYFIVKGEGTVTAEVKGERVGYEGKFYEKLDVIS